MRHLPVTAKVCGTLCFTLMLLVTMGLSSCSTGHWRLLATDTVSDGLAISDLVFIDSNHGWALTPAQLLETIDGGQTWTERLTSEKESYYSLTFVNPTTGWIVGTRNDAGAYNALIMRTTDGGKTWRPQVVNVAQQQDNQIAPRLHSVSFCNPQAGWAAGTDLILHTTDGGQTWETQRSGNKNDGLFGVTCVSPERAWAVGQDGLILQTKDGGKTWSRQDSGTMDNLVRVRFFGDSGWIVGGRAGNGTLLRTRDGGAKWERLQLDISEALFDIYMNGQQGWIVGASGTILHTNDGGQTWQQQKSPTDNDLISLSFASPQRGWAGGNKRTLLRYSN